uniref:Secreted protein n=1 Tax=Rhizophora mucronata TaxID=61149 RepID=A0A2P2J9G9_RHIMU
MLQISRFSLLACISFATTLLHPTMVRKMCFQAAYWAMGVLDPTEKWAEYFGSQTAEKVENKKPKKRRRSNKL